MAYVPKLKTGQNSGKSVNSLTMVNVRAYVQILYKTCTRHNYIKMRILSHLFLVSIFYKNIHKRLIFYYVSDICIVHFQATAAVWIFENVDDLKCLKRIKIN